MSSFGKYFKRPAARVRISKSILCWQPLFYIGVGTRRRRRRRTDSRIISIRVLFNVASAFDSLNVPTNKRQSVASVLYTDDYRFGSRPDYFWNNMKCLYTDLTWSFVTHALCCRKLLKYGFL